MKKFTALLLALLMAVTAFAACSNDADDSSADDSWTKVETAGKFVLGLDDSFPPMGYRDTETGEIVGFDIDLAKEVCKRLNLELVTQPIDWDAKLMELESGTIDCIWNGLTKTEEIEEKTTISDPYMNNTQVILVMADSGYSSRDDLAGKIVAVQSGSSGENAVNSDDQADFKASLKELIGTVNYTNAITELRNGTVDAIVLDEIVANDFMEKNPDEFKLVEKDGETDVLTEEEYVIAFRKGDEALKDKIVDTLKEMKEDGTLAEISTKWFGGDITTIK